MELFVSILIALGFLTPDSACAMPAPVLNQYVASQQMLINTSMQNPILMQQANQIMPNIIDRLED